MILIVPAIVAIGLLFIPESPGWLLQMKKEDKARKSLQRLRPCAELVEEELASMKAMIELETSLAQSTNIIDLWRNPIDRRRSLLAIGAVTLQVASGASFIIRKCKNIGVCRDFTSNFGRIQHLLLRNGQYWLSIRGQLHYGRHWIICFDSQ